MEQQLAYAIVTPHSLHKSRTGGIVARLMARSGLELVAARMFAPSKELVEEYASELISEANPQDPKIQVHLHDYVRSHLAPDPRTGTRRRVMVLLFRGEDAVRRLRSAVGDMAPDRRSGETIRDTYGDLVFDEDDKLVYFEPAVLAAPSVGEVRTKLLTWAKYSDRDGGLLENTITYRPGDNPERTLVLIKPDNFRFPGGRPGNVIDFFSRTGLFIVAIKVLPMSVAQALEFYGPVKEVLRTKLADMVGARSRTVLEKEFGFSIPLDVQAKLGALIGPLYGDNQFESIVRFMSGRAPSECPANLMYKPGSEKCIALVYEGPDAVRKIREVLGPTDPSKAPPGSIRREFGQSIMVNAAHASDSVESAQREFGIINPGENNFREVVSEFYGLTSV
jgi:nucleoside diphosphate kinase